MSRLGVLPSAAIKLCPMSMVYHICLCLTKAINFSKLYYYYTIYIYIYIYCSMKQFQTTELVSGYKYTTLNLLCLQKHM
jgi:hypothetical protein